MGVCLGDLDLVIVAEKALLKRLLGDDCVEGVVPESGGDAKTWKKHHERKGLKRRKQKQCKQQVTCNK